MGTDTEQAPLRRARRTGVNGILAARIETPLGCKAEGIADTGTQLIGHLDGDL